jgi:hypothetical protein
LLYRRRIERDVAACGNDLLPLSREQKSQELRRRATERLERRLVHTDIEEPAQRVPIAADVLLRRGIEASIGPGYLNYPHPLTGEEDAGKSDRSRIRGNALHNR